MGGPLRPSVSTMKLAIHYPNFTLPGGPAAIASTLAATARAAEAGGCSTFTLMDHWFQMEARAPAQDPMLEGYTALGFPAGQTEKMTLGLLVTGVTYRHPGLLAKIVTTLDVLSGGRAARGTGAGRGRRAGHSVRDRRTVRPHAGRLHQGDELQAGGASCTRRRHSLERLVADPTPDRHRSGTPHAQSRSRPAISRSAARASGVHGAPTKTWNASG